MMDFNGQDLEIFFICCITDTLTVTMDGQEDILIGCLEHLSRAKKMFPKYGEDMIKRNNDLIYTTGLTLYHSLL